MLFPCRKINMVAKTMLRTSLLVAIIISQFLSTTCDKQPPKFPAILVFGDSTVDSGNNNYIPTPFKGDHLPYGQDFPGHIPTGRFSDGKLVPDLLASFIGLKDIVPPFFERNQSKEGLLTGVSFASAGSGFDDMTSFFSRVIDMPKQPEYFRRYVEIVVGFAGEKKVEGILKDALVIVSGGTNDFIFNYYDLPTRKPQFNISEYQDFVQGKLEIIIKKIYDIGCRRMLISGLPPIGCLPIQRTFRPTDRLCLSDQNEDSQVYNDKLQKMLLRLEGELPWSRFLYVDIYNPLMDMINNPEQYGFAVTDLGCCGTGMAEVGPFCMETTRMCSDPSQYLFYDSIHPSEPGYRVIANNIAQSLLPEFFNSTKRR